MLHQIMKQQHQQKNQLTPIYQHTLFLTKIYIYMANGNLQAKCLHILFNSDRINLLRRSKITFSGIKKNLQNWLDKEADRSNTISFRISDSELDRLQHLTDKHNLPSKNNIKKSKTALYLFLAALYTMTDPNIEKEEQPHSVDPKSMRDLALEREFLKDTGHFLSGT